ncbi:beta-lactamase class A [Granulicella pectinivorans]|uniref:beta-lactamase n=1 Tax=Granulicella pectinivorans TaxID=474950 RepID=A0A1I6LTI9_9BACT|nr:class A beta-lactamase [Granulicella pectinivorans]SFS06650.1 beta-lactamase class A [Granulicella pectinivorans]
MRVATLIAVLALATTLPAQTLQQKLAKIAASANETVSVACALPNSTLNCDLNPDGHPPMQSVFKLPLGVAMLHLVEQGNFTLDQPIRFLPSDRIQPGSYSPLQDKYPDANVDVPLRELIRLSVYLSDNAAADTLLRLLGGTAALQKYMDTLGIQGFHIEDTEYSLHTDAQFQFRNWFTPRAAVSFLRLLADNSPLTPEHTQLLFSFMQGPGNGTGRIKAGLPADTVVRHKSGTSDTVIGVTYAMNDIALITLPDGRTLALAVFLTNSTDSQKDREATIAAIAKAVYEAAIAPK